MTDGGKLPCGLCKVWLPITEFYTLPVKEDTPIKDIWWGDPITRKQYGRPKSYCKACNNQTSKGRNAFLEYQAKVRKAEDTRIHDIDRAETKAYIERNRRNWIAEHGSLYVE